LLHNTLSSKAFGHAEGENTGLLFGLFVQGGFFHLGSDRALIIGYPVIPWLGVMLLGFGFGPIFLGERQKRRQTLLMSGTIALILFIVLRALNIYGDPSHWSAQSKPFFTFLSFINVTKYPPSLLYCAITLSVMFFVLYLADGKFNRLIAFFSVFGRVPMFFYILHWYIIHASMYVMLFLQGVSADQFQFGIMQFGRPAEGVGLRLPYIYLYWLCLIAFVYFLCKRYGAYKSANRHKKWLAYF
jgi:uncharacterized membrane protein